MSRAHDFATAYTASRQRLLLQLYAYCGDAEIALDAVDEAFIAASWHWHRVARLGHLDGWLRERAIRRIDGRPQALRDASANSITGYGAKIRERRGPRSGRDTRGLHPPTPELAASALTRAGPGHAPTTAAPDPATPPTPRTDEISHDNARWLGVLATLDPVTRRLLIIRRLDDTDLAAAAREVGLSDAAAEQALARAITNLHATGVDTTPSGLAARFARLADDLVNRFAPPADMLWRAGARRRYAMTTALCIGLVAVAAGVGALTAVRPFSDSAVTHQPQPTRTIRSTPTTPVAVLGGSFLLDAAAVDGADPDGDWQAVPLPRGHERPVRTSLYGSCMMVADDPPPGTSWHRDFVPHGRGAVPADRPLRQILLQAPSVAEAQRAFRQVTSGLSSCAGHQLVGYRSVGGLGDRARLLNLRYALPGGPVRQGVLIVRTGPAITVLIAKSAVAQAPEFDNAHLAALAASGVNSVCEKLSSTCALAPYPFTQLRPPNDGTPGGFVSVVDLPLVPGITATWAATNPTPTDRNPSATACDHADFSAAGAGSVLSRSYVMPDATKLPAVFGLSETIGVFPDEDSARAFVSQVAASVRTCHQRHPTIAMRGSTSFSTNLASGRVWRIRQQLSAKRAAVFRIALVRHGAAVAEMTFTPAGKYDVNQAEYVALARRAGLRLAT